MSLNDQDIDAILKNAAIIDNAIPSAEIPMHAQSMLEDGAKFPFDGSVPIDAAHGTALGVLADLSNRGGIDKILSDLPNMTKTEIVKVIAEIIRQGMAGNKVIDISTRKPV